MQTTHTKAPWSWFVSTTTKNAYLATRDRGRIFVMEFWRWGMQGAQPVFQDQDAGMVYPIAHWIKPDHNGMALEIDHPDARLIAAAPDLLEAAEKILNRCSHLGGTSFEVSGFDLDALENAILLAKGKD